MAERSVLVSGGSGGLGGAVLAAFVAEGWRVVAPLRPGSTAELPGGVTPIEADVTSPGDVEAAVAVAAGDPGAPLRAVVNLVGGYAGSGLVHETPIEDFEAILRTNLRPTYLVTAAALPHLVAAGRGSVVCLSSRAAVAPFAGAAGYVASKAAVLAFANAVAVEYKKQGVRANTDFSRWVSPAEIAQVILFLAGDRSAPTSGATIPVYGRA